MWELLELRGCQSPTMVRLKLLLLMTLIQPKIRQSPTMVRLKPMENGTINIAVPPVLPIGTPSESRRPPVVHNSQEIDDIAWLLTPDRESARFTAFASFSESVVCVGRRRFA